MAKMFLVLAVFIIVTVVFVVFGPSAQAGEYVFYPEQDAWVNEANAEANYGSGSYVTVKDRSDLTEAFIRFSDSELGILGDEQISTASLYLYQYQATYSPGDSISVHPVSQEWHEDTLTWNNKPTYAQEAVSSQLFTEGESLWREFPGLERYVSAWQDGQNFGFALENYGEGQKNELYTRFYSSEAADAQYKPYLKVTTTPEPVSMVLFGIGGAVFAVASRRPRRENVK